LDTTAIDVAPQPKKRKRHISRNLFVGVFGFFVLLFALAMMLPYPPPSKATASPVVNKTVAEPKPVIESKPKLRWVKVSDLLRAYEANEVSADRYFKGREFVIKGSVESVRKDMSGTPYVELTDTIAASPINFVQVYFSKKDEDLLVSLRTHQPLSVACEVQGQLLSLVSANHCRVADQSEIEDSINPKTAHK
jgi:hypothetical protein